MQTDKVQLVINLLINWIGQIFHVLENITFLGTNLLQFLISLIIIKLILTFIKDMKPSEKVKQNKKEEKE